MHRGAFVSIQQKGRPGHWGFGYPQSFGWECFPSPVNRPLPGRFAARTFGASFDFASVFAGVRNYGTAARRKWTAARMHLSVGFSAGPKARFGPREVFLDDYFTAHGKIWDSFLKGTVTQKIIKGKALLHRRRSIFDLRV